MNNDIYFDEHTQVDLKLTYFVSDDMSIFGDMQNITNEARGEYQGSSSNLFAQEVYGWTALFGMTYTF